MRIGFVCDASAVTRCNFSDGLVDRRPQSAIGKRDMNAFIVAPACNEAEVLADVLDELVQQCPWANVVVLDDRSSVVEG